MTYLELVNRLKQECGVQGADITTVVGQSREIQRLCNWVSTSFIEIQEEQSDWGFLRKPITFNTVASKQKYSVGSGLDISLADFASWRPDSFRAYLQTAGIATQIVLGHYRSYSEFRDFYLLGSRQLVTARPLDITIDPADKGLLLGFTPNDVYVVTAEYYRTPQILAVDTDVPIIPPRFHMAIVYKAMQKYGNFEAAGEQISAGKEGYLFHMNKLREDQLPMVMGAGSLI